MPGRPPRRGRASGSSCAPTSAPADAVLRPRRGRTRARGPRGAGRCARRVRGAVRRADRRLGSRGVRRVLDARPIRRGSPATAGSERVIALRRRRAHRRALGRRRRRGADGRRSRRSRRWCAHDLEHGTALLETVRRGSRTTARTRRQPARSACTGTRSGRGSPPPSGRSTSTSRPSPLAPSSGRRCLRPDPP